MLKKITVLLLSLLLQAPLNATEGFAQHTRVLTIDGYIQIKDLKPGTLVVCLTKDGTYDFTEITTIEKTQALIYYRFKIGTHSYNASVSQLFYNLARNQWTPLCEFYQKEPLVTNYKQSSVLSNFIKKEAFRSHKKAHFYKISLKEHHTFFIDNGVLCCSSDKVDAETTVSVYSKIIAADTTMLSFLEAALKEYAAHTITFNDSDCELTDNDSVDGVTEVNIINESTYEKHDKKLLIHAKYNHDYNDALADFNRLQLSNVDKKKTSSKKNNSSQPEVMIGTDKNKSTVIVRNISSDGRATLEFQHADKQTQTKIRYDKKNTNQENTKK